MYDENEDYILPEGTSCGNCHDETHVPDERTGLIHKHGKYACYKTFEADGKERVVRLETVAE